MVYRPVLSTAYILFIKVHYNPTVALFPKIMNLRKQLPERGRFRHFDPLYHNFWNQISSKNQDFFFKHLLWSRIQWRIAFFFVVLKLFSLRQVVLYTVFMVFPFPKPWSKPWSKIWSKTFPTNWPKFWSKRELQGV